MTSKEDPWKKHLRKWWKVYMKGVAHLPHGLLTENAFEAGWNAAIKWREEEDERIYREGN